MRTRMNRRVLVAGAAVLLALGAPGAGPARAGAAPRRGIDRVPPTGAGMAVAVEPATSSPDSFEHFWSLPPDTSYVRAWAGGGALAWLPIYFETPELGWTVSANLRPRAARSFYPSFDRRNIGLGLELSYLEFRYTRRVVAGSVIFRQYLRRMDRRPGEDSAFAGLGVGVIGIAWDRRAVQYRNAAIVAEVGYEFRTVGSAVVSVRMQARRMRAGPVNLSGVGVSVTAGWRIDG